VTEELRQDEELRKKKESDYVGEGAGVGRPVVERRKGGGARAVGRRKKGIRASGEIGDEMGEQNGDGWI